MYKDLNRCKIPISVRKIVCIVYVANILHAIAPNPRSCSSEGVIEWAVPCLSFGSFSYLWNIGKGGFTSKCWFCDSKYRSSHYLNTEIAEKATETVKIMTVVVSTSGRIRISPWTKWWTSIMEVMEEEIAGKAMKGTGITPVTEIIVVVITVSTRPLKRTRKSTRRS